MLTVEGLQVVRNDAAVLHDVTLTVGRGEAVAVIGSNGAGKSTLLRVVCGLLPASAGSVRYAGAEVLGVPAYELSRRGVAYVPAERRLFGAMTVGENLAMGAYPARPAASRTASVHDLFPRLAERRTQRAGTLSGGEQQMVAIGRALMSSPALMLLDEPSTGLAPSLADETYAALARARHAGDITILVAEQRVSLALEFSDRAYVLEQGRVQFDGSSAHVRDDPRVQRAYLGIG